MTSLFGDTPSTPRPPKKLQEYKSTPPRIRPPKNLQEYESTPPRIRSSMNINHMPSNTDTRLTLFTKKQDWLKSLNKDGICSLSSFGKIKKFSEGAVGQSFGCQDTNIAIKVVDKNERSEKEIECYNYFTDYVEKNSGFPHFPLIYSISECDNVSLTQTYGSRTTVELVKKNAYLIFSELAEGTLKDVISQLSEEEMIGMIFQVLMACLVLENKGYVHNDLEPANILFYSYDRSPAFFENTEYIEYRIDTHTMVRVKHFKRLYVLWDFGMMVKNGVEDPRDKGHIIINTLNNDLKVTFFPILSRNYRKYTGKYENVQKILNIFDDRASIENVRDLVLKKLSMQFKDIITIIEF